MCDGLRMKLLFTRSQNEAFIYSCMLNQNSVETVSIDIPHLSSHNIMFAWKMWWNLPESLSGEEEIRHVIAGEIVLI